MMRAALVFCAALAACTPEPRPDSACKVLRPISFSARDDTAQTVREIREQNAALYSLCPGLAPRRP